MATPKPLLVIVGINSRQGSSVAHAILPTNQFRILGITNNASCARSHAWFSSGVSLVQISDYSDVEYLEQAFAGAAAIFAVTDFYRHIDDQSTHSLANVGKMSVEEVAGFRELREGRAIVEAATKVKGLQRLVLSSLLKVGDAEGDQEKRGLQQFKSKAGVVEYLLERHEELADKTSLLIPALYMEHWTMFLRKNADDTFTFGTTLPPNLRIPWTHIAADTGTFFKLCLATPARTNHAAVSCLTSGYEICTLFTTITGIACKYTQYPPAELSALLGPRGHITVDMLSHIGAKKYYDGPAIKVPPHLYDSVAPSQFTSFTAHMTASLPAFFQELENSALGLREGRQIHVFHSGRRSSEDDARATSVEMVRRGFVKPTLMTAGGVRTANGRDRGDWIGNFGDEGEGDGNGDGEWMCEFVEGGDWEGE